jgi:hypothetical protein
MPLAHSHLRAPVDGGLTPELCRYVAKQIRDYLDDSEAGYDAAIDLLHRIHQTLTTIDRPLVALVPHQEPTDGH